MIFCSMGLCRRVRPNASKRGPQRPKVAEKNLSRPLLKTNLTKTLLFVGADCQPWSVGGRFFPSTSRLRRTKEECLSRSLVCESLVLLPVTLVTLILLRRFKLTIGSAPRGAVPLWPPRAQRPTRCTSKCSPPTARERLLETTSPSLRVSLRPPVLVSHNTHTQIFSLVSS